MNKIMSSLEAQNAPTSAREFMLCSLGRLCPVSTPEGKRAGLFGQEALGASVRVETEQPLGALHTSVIFRPKRSNSYVIYEGTGYVGMLRRLSLAGVSLFQFPPLY